MVNMMDVGQQEETTSKTTKILVIEDSRDLREDVVEMLLLEGYQAFGAENGVIGVERAHDEHPDLIVCDIMMPELDGFGVLQELRGVPTTARIPFIFLTAKTERIDMRNGMVLGADDFLTKPFVIEELLASIDTQLKKRQELNLAATARMEQLRKNIITALPHEFRTPLNTVIGFSDMMLMEAGRLKPDQVADWAIHINGAAHRLHRLIENYVYYVRLQVALDSAQDAELTNVETISGVKSLTEIAAMKIAQQYERSDDLIMEIEDADYVQIGYSEFTKVIEEIIENGFKFSEPDPKNRVPKPVTVTGKLNTELNRYELQVHDKGRGMTADQIKSIGAFTQFERWLYEQQGMGLGLAIVKLLMQLNKGQLDIQSVHEQETTVTISFNIAQN